MEVYLIVYIVVIAENIVLELILWKFGVVTFHIVNWLFFLVYFLNSTEFSKLKLSSANTYLSLFAKTFESSYTGLPTLDTFGNPLILGMTAPFSVNELITCFWFAVGLLNPLLCFCKSLCHAKRPAFWMCTRFFIATVRFILPAFRIRMPSKVFRDLCDSFAILPKGLSSRSSSWNKSTNFGLFEVMK